MSNKLSKYFGKNKVEISNDITKDDQTLWNLLIDQVDGKIKPDHFYSILIPELLRVWAKNKTEDDVKRSLNRLMFYLHCHYPDRGRECAFGMLAGVFIRNNTLLYAYTDCFLAEIQHPTVSSFMDHLGLKYAQAL